MSQFEAHLHAILDLPIPTHMLQLRQPSIMLNILGGVTPDAHMQLVKAALQVGSKVHLYGKGSGTLGRKMGHITITARTMSEAECRLTPLLQVYDVVAGRSDSKPNLNVESTNPARPVVAVLMGSDSDLKTMEPGIAILRKFNIPHTVRVTSAHRTPKLMFEFANNAIKNGIKVIIAGAGGAAHLPGMVASETSLPVIGVPVKASVLDGVDSLYSIVQMPRGVPVATVGISNSTNAALLAARILGVEDLRVRGEVERFQASNAEESTKKDIKLQKLGSERYLEQM
jgi:phosphoribosylaminoimidazole carboxylase